MKLKRKKIKGDRMKEIPYKSKISPKMRSLIIIISLFFIGIVLGIIISNLSIGIINDIIEKLKLEINAKNMRYLTNILSISFTLLCINIVLLLTLLWLYIDSYRKTKSSFMLGLTFFIGVLLVRSLLSLSTMFALFTQYVKALPTIWTIIGDTGYGSFSFFLNIFEIIALTILLYLSME